MLEGLRGRACCRTVCSASFPPHMCRATVKGREMLGKHVGQTAWQNTLADIFANHLCRRCWPLPLPGGFALMWPGVLSIPRLHQVIVLCSSSHCGEDWSRNTLQGRSLFRQKPPSKFWDIINIPAGPFGF